MPLVRVPIYPTRNLATEIDPGARTINAGTNVSFSVQPDGSITINASGGGTGTVTSVGATGSTGLTVGGSPITTSGTLTFTLSANLQSWSGIAPASKADTSALGNYVLKAGDTMSGTLINTASIGFDHQRSAGRFFIRDNGSGQPTLDFVNPANSAWTTGRSTAAGWVFTSTGGPFDFVNGNLRVQNGDLYSYRTGGTTGVIFLRQDATRYLYYDGGTYQMPGAPLNVGATINSENRQITGLVSNVGYQIVWNIVQVGQGRTEFVNNNGGGSGGFTFYDRASTASGLSVALAAVLSSGTVLAQPTAANPANYASFGIWTAGSFGGGMSMLDGGLAGSTWLATGPGRRLWGFNNGAGGAALTSVMVLDTSGNLSPNGYVWPSASVGGNKKLSQIVVSNAAPGALADGTLYLRY